MRVRASTLLATALTVLVAGCVTPVDVATDDPEPAGASAAPAASPRVDVDIRHDFRDPEAKEAFEIPPRAGGFEVWVGFKSPAGVDGVTHACAGDIRLVLLKPSGAQAKNLDVSGFATGGDRCWGGHFSNAETLEPGTWTVEFSGTGFAVGIVRITDA